MDYKNLNDYEIFYMIGENNDDYLKIMFDKYEPVINKLSFAYYQKFKGIGINIDDLKQECRVGLMKAVNSYDPNNILFYSYAIICMERTLSTYVRNFNNKGNYLLNNSIRDLPFDLKDSSANSIVDDVLIENEIFFKYKNLLNFKLSVIFELRYNGFSYKEISTLLDLSKSTIDGRMAMLRKKIKNSLKENI